MSFTFYKQRAFTLIELLVVILIIGILIAVAAPSFIGQQAKAHNSAAKQELTVARKAVKALHIDKDNGYGAYSDTEIIDELHDNEPQYNFITYVAPGNATSGTVSVRVESNDVISMCLQSRSSSFFCLRADEQAQQTELIASTHSLMGIEDAYAAGGRVSVRYSVGDSESDARAALTDSIGEGRADKSASNPASGSGSPFWSDTANGNGTVITDPSTGDGSGGPSTIPGPSVLVDVRMTNTNPYPNTSVSFAEATWSEPVTLTHQWQRQLGTSGPWVDIPGAVNYEYTTGNADRGYRFRVIERGTNAAGGFTLSTSEATSVISVVIPPSINDALYDAGSNYYGLQEQGCSSEATPDGSAEQLRMFMTDSKSTTCIYLYIYNGGSYTADLQGEYDISGYLIEQDASRSIRMPSHQAGEDGSAIGVVEWSLDGSSWNDISATNDDYLGTLGGSPSYKASSMLGSPVRARYLRLRNTGPSGHWTRPYTFRVFGA